MAGQQGTINARFYELLTSLRERLNLREIRSQLRAGASETFSPDVARVLTESASKLAGVLPSPVGLALQSVLFLADSGLQAHDNKASVVSLHDQFQQTQEQLHRLEGLGSLPDTIQPTINRITNELLLVLAVVDDLQRTPASGWWKCTSYLRALVCAKCDAQNLQSVAANLSTVLTRIRSILDEIISLRVERPSDSSPELPAHLDAGMDLQISKVMGFLRTNTSGNESVRVVGLHGEGGIGKTTLMYAVHHHLMHGTMPQPHKIATLEVGMTPPPSTKLQESLFSQLSGGSRLEFSSAAQGKSELKSLFASHQSDKKPVCIFLDNVWKWKHLEELLPEKLADVLPGGSYIVITSRSQEVVRRLGQMCFKSGQEVERGYLHYQLELLGEEDAVKLFLKTASKQGESSPLSSDDELVKTLVPLCSGLPLALVVYGAFFKDKRKREPKVWRSVCRELRAAQDLPPSCAKDSVFQKLKPSIEFQSEGLQDAFLDIALFFNRNCRFDVDTVKYAMKEEDYLESLVEQSLVRVDEFWGTSRLVVHDLLVLVARQMATERSIAILPAPTSKHEYDPCEDGMQVRYFNLREWAKLGHYPTSSQMKGCRYLILKDLGSKDFPVDYFFGTITRHCHSVRLLELGKGLCDEPHFQELVFPWIANLKKLKVLFLSGPTTFAVASTPKIQQLSMLGGSLAGLPPEIGQLTALTSLGLRGCRRLAGLPPEIGQLTALTSLGLRECRCLAGLPPEIGQLTSLTSLDLSGCGSLAGLPPEIGQLTALTSLGLRGCGSLAGLPPEIGQLTALTRLGLRGCGSLAGLPPEIGQLTALTCLGLDECRSLARLPSEIGQLTALTCLGLARCRSLAGLPPEIGQLTALMELGLAGCGNLAELPPEIGQLTALMELRLAGCGSLAELPPEIWQLTALTILGLSGCGGLAGLPPEIGQLTALTCLDLSRCGSLAGLPPEIGQLTALTVLGLVGCGSLARLPSEIGQLTALTKLGLGRCGSLAGLPSEIGQLTALTELGLRWCGSLAGLGPEIGLLTALTRLGLDGGLAGQPAVIGQLTALTRLACLYVCGGRAGLPPEIGQLTALTELGLRGWGALAGLPPEIGQLTALTRLDVSGCGSLAGLPLEIGQLTALMRLDMCGCRGLAGLPPEIGQLTALMRLALVGCRGLVGLPPEIGQLTALTCLTLSGCRSLAGLPPEIRQLTALTRRTRPAWRGFPGRWGS